MNDFLRRVATQESLRRQLRTSDPLQAAQLAQHLGFDVTVGDLVRYQARATSWSLSDAELEVVVTWQRRDQPYWWQFAWPDDARSGA